MKRFALSNHYSYIAKLYPAWPRDLELIRWTPVDKWTLDQATRGVLVTGATGSGKSTGPFQYILRSLLRIGAGGLFLVANSDAAAVYSRLAEQEGRAQDVLVFRPDTPGQGFNFLRWEAQQRAPGKAIIENLVLLLMQAVEIAARRHSGGDQFFEDAMKQLLRNCLLVVILARGEVDLGSVLQLVQTLPQDLNEAEQSELFSLRLLDEAAGQASPTRLDELALARRYFTWEWPALNDRTRSSIAITLSVLLDSFLRYPLHDLFLNRLTVSPDDVLAGRLVIVDLSVEQFDFIGKVAGTIWKYSVQRAIERRPELLSGRPIETIRPIFIAADECQYWATSTDGLFQMSARSARGISLYASQSIPNFYNEMGGDGTARARVDSLLGNLQNRLACQNLDQTTNQWYSDSIGRIIHQWKSHSVTNSSSAENYSLLSGLAGASRSVSNTKSEQLNCGLQPRAFAGLKRGAQGQVEAILVAAGDRSFSSRKPWLRVSFNQFRPPSRFRRWFTNHAVITAPRMPATTGPNPGVVKSVPAAERLLLPGDSRGTSDV